MEISLDYSGLSSRLLNEKPASDCSGRVKVLSSQSEWRYFSLNRNDTITPGCATRCRRC